jgi:hypothetical protein
MRTIAVGLICSLLLMSPNDAFAGQQAAGEATTWHTVAAAIPLGSKVKIQTTTGRGMSGTLMRVSQDGVLLKKNTRRPEPAVAVSFAEMARIERDTYKGFNVGKAIAVGLAAGAGVILGMFAIAVQLD